MKLLQLNVTANWGSTGKIAEGIGMAAMERGWESAIAYGRYANASQSKLIKVGGMADVYAHYALNRFLDAEGLGSRRATRQLVKEIETYGPDVIHLHNIHDHWLNYPILFDYLASIDTPIVWTFHDCWAFTGGCHYFEQPPCDKWKVACRECPNKRGLIDNSKNQFERRIELFSRLLPRLVIVPVSHWLENYCNESILKDAKIKLIHNGIDTTLFSDRNQSESKPLILGVANLWNSRKGLSDFIKLRDYASEDDADIILVGLSNKQISSLPNGINGIERTQSVKELVQLYNRATVLVNPTYADNFPTVNLEALACGTPVITYRTGGSPEAIDDNTGIIVEKGDIQGLADAVNRIITNPSAFSSQSCRNRAVQHFNQDVQFGKYLDLYKHILSHK